MCVTLVSVVFFPLKEKERERKGRRRKSYDLSRCHHVTQHALKIEVLGQVSTLPVEFYVCTVAVAVQE